MTIASVAATRPEVPPQANNSYRFSLFNAVNFQITLGAPMVLYAKVVGRQCDHDRDRRVPGAADDRAPASNGLFHSEDWL